MVTVLLLKRVPSVKMAPTGMAWILRIRISEPSLSVKPVLRVDKRKRHCRYWPTELLLAGTSADGGADEDKYQRGSPGICRHEQGWERLLAMLLPKTTIATAAR